MSNHPIKQRLDRRTAVPSGSKASDIAQTLGHQVSRKAEDNGKTVDVIPRWIRAQARAGNHGFEVAYERELLQEQQEEDMALIDGNTGRPVGEQYFPEKDGGVYQRPQAPVGSPMEKKEPPRVEDEDEHGDPPESA